MRVYVAGPMRGYPRFNFDAFDAVAAHLRRIDSKNHVISPAEHDRVIYPDIEDWPGFADGDISACPQFNLHDAMSWDLAQVATADAICMLPGWEDSSGASHERYVAEVCGKHVWLAEPRSNRGLRLSAWCIAPDSIQVRVSTPRAEISSEYHVDDRDPCESEMAWQEEQRIVDPTTGGAKGRKLARFDLVPARPLYALAEHFGRGASKYEDRNWEAGYAWSLSFGALMRHAWAWWGGEDNDPELGSSHLDAIGFHAFALREFLETHPELDDRPAAA